VPGRPEIRPVTRLRAQAAAARHLVPDLRIFLRLRDAFAVGGANADNLFLGEVEEPNHAKYGVDLGWCSRGAVALSG
jgi:hypothetical protein